MRLRCHCRMFVVVAGVLLGLGAVAAACNVPVFRYALERWRADPYRAVVFYQGELSPAESEILKPLVDQQEMAPANLSVRLVAVDKLADESEDSAADRQLLAALGSPKLPFLAVQYPEHLKIPVPVWAGPLGRESLATLVDSPLRQKLVERLAAGQTAVWLLLESGDSAKDDAAAELLTAELQTLEQTLKLPELTSADEDVLLAATPLKISFSTLRVPRGMPAEQALVAMLLGSEPDLAGLAEPMVFPVFGRGRALLPLIGAGITAKNIHESAEFLAGPCSCQVKEQNPGFDLLLTANWDTLLSTSGVPLVAAAANTASPAGEPELVEIPAGSQPPAAVTPSRDVSTAAIPSGAARRQPWGTVVFAVVGGVAILAVLVLLLAGRGSAKAA